MGKVGLADRTNILNPCVTDGGPEGDAVVYTVNRVPTIMEKPGKFWKKTFLESHGKFVKN